MELQNCLNEAITEVLTLDIPEEAFGDAVNDRAYQLAGINPEEIRRPCLD